MARARNIKPALFKNEVLGVADPLNTILFEGLWVLADRDGRLEDRPLRIKAEVFPYRDGLDMVSMLSWLEQAGFIRRYSANGLALIQVENFAKHQNPHKNEPESLYPAPAILGAASEEIGSARADPGFLIPDSPSLIADTSAAAAPSRKKAKPPKTQIPENFCISERVRVWAKRKEFGKLEQHLEVFIAKCKAKAYENVSWDDAFMEAIREDWAKLRGRTKDGSAAPPDGGDGEWHDTRPGIEARAAELGLPPYDGLEQFPAYKARVIAAHQQGAH